MKPFYGDACVGCVCIGCVQAGDARSRWPSCPCCANCVQEGKALLTKNCSGFEGWPAC